MKEIFIIAGCVAGGIFVVVSSLVLTISFWKGVGLIP